MEDNPYLDLAFLVFGLGFFLLVVYIILHSHKDDKDRALNDRREFGFADSKLRKKGVILPPHK